MTLTPVQHSGSIRLNRPLDGGGALEEICKKLADKRRPSATDIKNLLQFCRREHGRLQSIGCPWSTKLKKALDTLLLVMKRAPETAIPLVAGCVDVVLADRTIRRSQPSRIATQLLEYQCAHRDIDDAGIASLRFLAADGPPCKLLPIEAFVTDMKSGDLRATRSLMRLAGVVAVELREIAAAARQALVEHAGSRPRQFNLCACEILRELGERDAKPEEAWARLQKLHCNKEREAHRKPEIRKKIVYKILTGLRGKDMPSGSDIRLLLDLCTIELQQFRATGNRTEGLPQAAEKALRIALGRSPDVTMPILERFIRDALAGNSGKPLLPPQMAFACWEFQRDQFDINETGLACLRYLAPRARHIAPRQLVGTEAFVRELDKGNGEAVLFLMRLAGENNEFLAGEIRYARAFLSSRQDKHKKLFEACARSVLEGRGHKEIEKGTAWQTLSRQILQQCEQPKGKENCDPNRTIPEQKISVEEEKRRRERQLAYIDKAYLPALRDQDEQQLKRLIDGALSSDNQTRKNHIAFLCRHYRQFKSAAPRLTEYFVRRCQFQRPHVALALLFLSASPGNGKLIEIAQTRIVPTDLRGSPQQGTEGQWRAHVNEINGPSITDAHMHGWMRELVQDVAVTIETSKWNEEALCKYVKEFKNSRRTQEVRILPALDHSVVTLLMTRDRKNEVTVSLLSNLTGRTEQDKQADREISKALCEASRSLLMNIEHFAVEPPLREYELVDDKITRDNPPDLIDAKRWSALVEQSRILPLELLEFMRRRKREQTGADPSSMAIIDDFMSEYKGLTSTQRSQSYRDRRVEACISSLLDLDPDRNSFLDKWRKQRET